MSSDRGTMTYTLLSDEELFALVRDREDEQAYRTLYRRYDKRLYSYCLRAMGNPDDAQDVFQTISLTVFDKRRSFVDGSFAAWLFTITRNMCLKALRSRKHKVEFNEEFIAPEEESTHSQDFLLKRALHTAIAELPEEFREALELRYFDDLSYDDIALTLSITVSLAKVRVFRAKKLITQKLSPILDELK
jgi:RNA polymerase sigma-70 factor (ECF subfamily)